MAKRMKFELKQQFVFETECESFEFEVIDPSDEIDARLNEIEGKIANLNISIDKLKNNADALDYTVAIASGVITGLIDAFLVGETEIDKEKIQKVLENKYHTANDDEYKHKDTNGNWISSAMYHRLDDLAHHPTLLGLSASILVRYLRLVVFVDGSDGKPHIFFADKTQKNMFLNLETGQLQKAWMGIIISGLFMWLATVAENKLTEKYVGDLPESLRKIIIFLGGVPLIIEVLKTADTWVGHMMSDVSTPQGIPGVFLSLLKEISVLPALRNSDLPVKVDKLYREGKFNLSEWGGVAFVVAKEQALPVLINEILVRGFYFVRRLIIEYKDNQNIKDMNWDAIIPIGNRTIERMITIATGTFSAINLLDALIESAINSKANWVEFGRQMVLRLNFVGIGRFTIALGTDVFMGLRKGKKSKERMLLKAELLYLMQAKLYYGESLLWAAVQDTNQSVDSLFDAMQRLSIQVAGDLKAAQGSIRDIEQMNISAIEEHNQGLTSELLDTL